MSSDIAQIDKRLSLVETGLTQVQQRLGIVASPANWVEQVSGSLADISENDYQKFLQCCRAVRNEASSEEAQQ